MFLELDARIVQRLLEKPIFVPQLYLNEHSSKHREMVQRERTMLYRYELTYATNTWLNHNIGERKKYEKVLLATARQYIWCI